MKSKKDTKRTLKIVNTDKILPFHTDRRWLRFKIQD